MSDIFGFGDGGIFGDFDKILKTVLGCRLCGAAFSEGESIIETTIGKVHAHCNVDADKWRMYFIRKGEKQ